MRAAILLAALLAAARADAVQGVHGMVYGKDRDDPVAGALVVLYDSGEFLVDSTYSRDDGRFTLRPPQPGAASILAYRDDLAHREEIAYDPARNRPVWVRLAPREESRLKQAVTWVFTELGAVIGLLVGYGFRVLVEERGGARRKRDDFLSDLRGLADQALIASGFPETAAEVTRMRQFVDRRADDMKDVLSTLSLMNKEEARKSVESLRQQVADTEALLTGTFKSDVDRETKLEQARSNLAAIHRLRLG